MSHPFHSLTDDELRGSLEKQLPTVLDALERMVRINSFTANRDGVNRLGKLTAEMFSTLGFKPEFVASTNPAYGDHLVMTKAGASGRTMGFISHLDTVFPPEEEARNQFVWRREGDRIYGPGTMDIKGGTALIWMIMRALAEAAPELWEQMTWTVLLNSSEEVLSSDFGALCRERLRDGGLAALTFEAGARVGNAFSLVTARKGRAVFRITVQGRGAHAGSHHERGANAVVQLAETLRSVAALTDYSKALTFNPGTVQGGTVVNRVPHWAAAEVEMRAFDDAVFRAGYAAMLGLAGRGEVGSVEDGFRCEVQVEGIQESCPWPRNPGTERLFNVYQEIGRSLGMTVVREERGGISDANFLWQTVPVIDGLGPNGDNAHCSERSDDGLKEQEYVEVSSFVPKALLSARAIERWSVLIL